MKIGRNAPCPCGSGKKYKKCCLNKPQPLTQNPPNQEQSIHMDSGLEKSGIQIRPYVMAKMCDPEEPYVQQLLARSPELRANSKKMVAVSDIRALSFEQLIERLSEQGARYDEAKFIATCQKEESAWRVADRLWPKQAKSWESGVSDNVCLCTCAIWSKLYGEKKLDKVSFEMLDDWMESGYKTLEKDNLAACRIWMRVWETFKSDYDVANRSIDEIDTKFNGSQSFFNWCQDCEMEMINASIDSPEFAQEAVSFLSEFVEYFPNEDAHLVNQFSASLAESYCRSGEQAAGEHLMQQLIEKHPDDVVGYIGMEKALSMRELNDQSPTLYARLEILEAAKQYPVTNGDDYDLDRRIDFIKKTIGKNRPI